MKQKYQDHLDELKRQSNLRHLSGPVPGGMINLSSNDYLGINADRQLKAEFREMNSSGSLDFSAVSSRLLSGDCAEYDRLELGIAGAYRRESCLVLNSGYHANIGVLPALAGSRDLILADKLVHASMIDGLNLSKAEVKRFGHVNYEHLGSLLQKYRKDYEQVFSVTESIFSMDGDLADLHTLVKLKKEYDAFLYVDEAHALGVAGPEGLGLAEQCGLTGEVDFIVGTFGKALASLGAFVVCDAVFREYLINTSRSLIFTTALPPLNLAWTDFIFRKMMRMEDRRKQLWQLSCDFAGALNSQPSSHIIPVIIGDNREAVCVAGKLRQEGFYVLPVRHPTVPAGTARLRISLYAGLDMTELDRLIKLLKPYEKNVD